MNTPKELEDAWSEYLQKVYEFATKKLEEIKPWFIENKLSLAHGTYGWTIGQYGPPPHKYDDAHAPVEILNALRIRVQGCPNNDLGDFMEDFFYEEESNE